MRQYVLSAGTGNLELKYFKTMMLGEGDATKFYGVSVEKYIDGKFAEEMESGPFTEDIAEADETIDKLAENCVMPFDLCATLDAMHCNALTQI